MGIDISQFLQTFYEESFEGLDLMENALLGLDIGAADRETINSIFRAAHSIKGGAGTFGLMEVANFTHAIETMLDQMRDGRRDVNQEDADLLLSSVDVIRDMLKASQGGGEMDAGRVASMKHQIEQRLSDDLCGKGGKIPSSVPRLEQGAGWKIAFRPLQHLFRTGNDPVRIFRELSSLGEMQVKVDTSDLPEFDLIDPENCYLSWEIELHGDIAKERIEEIFSWLDGDCNIDIEPMSQTAASHGKSALESSSVDPHQHDTKASLAEVNFVSEQKRQAKSPANQETGSIRVAIDKVDALVNMVGELVITQSMLNQLGADFGLDRLQKLQEGLAALERNTRELQESVMRIRMLPISFAFNRFPRLVHDLSHKLGKKIELRLSGEQTELDKTVMEKIGDPLVHLVRNSLDHGIETPEVRRGKGKPETGILHLNAYHQSGNIVIEIKDDGAGLNYEKILAKARKVGLIGSDEVPTEEKVFDLIFEPGFSTSDQVSDVSGRGVGMDVVKRNIKDLGGIVEVKSARDIGAIFIIRLPLTLAILDGQLVRIGREIFVIPLTSIVESLQMKQDCIKSIGRDAEIYRLREEYVPIIRLHDVFGIKPDNNQLSGGLLVVVEGDNGRIGLFVDDLLGQQQVVIKSLESNFKKIDGLSGATILGDGTVALILDIAGLVKLSKSGIGNKAGFESARSVAA